MGLEADKVLCQVSPAQEQWSSCPEAALKDPDKRRNLPRINGELVSYLQNKALMGDRTHSQLLWLLDLCHAAHEVTVSQSLEGLALGG